ncbi:DUF2939 domain-containing protein [Noviherbaspirillum saxi]|uniref:DUF2939 domain-containing protein n=1 Tax=Noviherbaspirillum saxi TaxID=2320863 RepID=A0A3A3FP52_9BURK|nr:DUF2939 domain-containing protein [Noviherbaspirillum saxi]RJF97962.1 DUF2939 domain-containing protein [Noviherbaspirillum saxi]
MKRLAAAALTLAILLVLASYFSPHWTLYRMRSAIENRDYESFSSYVDFPALRSSLKEQVTGTTGRKPGVNPNHGNSLESLTETIVNGLAGPLIDVMLTPPGIIEMLHVGKPGITRNVVVSTLTQVPDATVLPAMTVSYRGWERVVFRGANLPAESGNFVLRRQNLWTWKLAEVELERQSGKAEPG